MGSNHTSRVIYQLSQLIVRGEIAAGEKLAEIPLAERFGVSRTPIRHALSVLEQEGLLTRSSGRSYVVRRFSLEEILNAIEVRSVLEGLAAREVAQGRLPRSLIREFDLMLVEAGEILDKIETSGPNAELTERYYVINERFHRAILIAANNRAIVTALEVVGKVPFGSVGSIARYSDTVGDDEDTIREKTRLLIYSHLQHQEILEALKQGHASRAESIMREHAHLGIRNLHLRDNYTAELSANAIVGFGA